MCLLLVLNGCWVVAFRLGDGCVSMIDRQSGLMLGQRCLGLAAALAEEVDEGEDGALFVIAERFTVVFDPVGTG